MPTGAVRKMLQELDPVPVVCTPPPFFFIKQQCACSLLCAAGACERCDAQRHDKLEERLRAVARAVVESTLQPLGKDEVRQQEDGA